MGRYRLPFTPVSSTMASHACSVEAESAEVTPLQVLPPMVPALRICGPPTMSTASPSTLIFSMMMGLCVMWEKVVSEPMRMFSSSSMLMPRMESIF